MAVAVLVSTLTVPTLASAQTPPKTAEQTQREQEARTRYERGKQLVADQEYRLARIEFKRAYELNPSYKLLRTIASVDATLGDYAGAVRSLEAFLRDGKSDISAKDRAEVDKELQSYRTRTANVAVTSNVDGAEVAIDDVVLGVTPLPDKLLVTAGQHKISVTKSGYEPVTKSVTLAGLDDYSAKFELQEVAPPAPIATAPVPVTTQPDAPPTTSPQPRKPEEPSARSNLWVGWTMTGVFAAGAIATGIAAVANAGQITDLREGAAAADPAEASARRGELDAAASRAKRLAIVADILGGAAIVTGGVTLVLTVSSSPRRSNTSARARTRRTVRLGLSPSGISFAGTL